MKRFFLIMLTAALFAGATQYASAQTPTPVRPPNVVIIFIDDMGYADIGPFGAKGYTTPNLDRMAAEGMKFTNFYAAQAVCTASRVGLMTGCYPNRVGVVGALHDRSKIGISDKEMTIAQVVKPLGYATAIYGKWHLGDALKFLPLQHGFDEYFGLPYSIDVSPQGDGFHYWKGTAPLPLIENNKILKPEVTGKDMDHLTTWYTQHAVQFIQQHKYQPFFLYVPHSMVHVPLHVSDKFRGKTTRGLFGDVVEEVDWSVGEILAAIKKAGVDDNTLVIFSSDNGPWLCYGDHAGSAGPLREGKGTSFDGGVREPTLMRWPGKIPAGATCAEPCMAIDLLPTIARLTGAPLPPNKIDGLDIWPLMAGEKDVKSPHEVLYFYYNQNDLESLRSGKWSLQFPHTYQSLNGRPGGTGGRRVEYEKLQTPLALFDLDSDVGEKHNVADQNPDVVKHLLYLADQMREDLGDNLTHHKGTGRREPGRLSMDEENTWPQSLERTH
jgi:arylsulfatase A